MSEPVALDLDEADDTDLAAAASRRLRVGAELAGARLDKALAGLLADVSRSRLQQWIACGAVRVNGAAASRRQPLVEGDTIEVEPPPAPEDLALQPESIALDVVYDDGVIAVLDKPAGLVVHPAAGNWSGTLANGLLARFPQVAGLPRAGIVHRLDAQTSGLMVVALTLQAHTDLVRQLQARSVLREYWAIVQGAVAERVTIDAALARDPRNPLRFAVSRSASAKVARTQVRRVQTVQVGATTLSWVACRLDTGRTHQIRVHLEAIGHPLVGDPVYRRGRQTGPAATRPPQPWQGFARQALHACRLALVHPVRRATLQWFRAPPSDMRELMAACGFMPADRPVEVFE